MKDMRWVMESKGKVRSWSLGNPGSRAGPGSRLSKKVQSWNETAPAPGSPLRTPECDQPSPT